MAEIIIYGAYGYTGELIVKQAIELGMKPLLSGRSESKLAALAKVYDLPFKACNLIPSELDALLAGNSCRWAVHPHFQTDGGSLH
jgi:short subunit dehydrogenase-like uncharacterized protein